MSIVLPCYSRSKNHPEFLDLALKKILSSISLTKLQYEICIFDNASEFSIVEVLEKYKNLNIKYKKSILKHKPNDSWFNAVKMSSGNYIHIHSMDDEVDDNFYIVLEKYIKNNKIDLLYTTAKNLNNHDYDKAFTDWKYNWPSNYSCYFNPNKNNSFIKHPMPSSSWIVRREFYENHGIFENWNLGMDLDLSYRLQKYSKISYFCKEAFLYYRSHENSGNNLDNPKLKKEFIWNLQKIKFIFKYKDLSEINKKKIIFEYINNYFLIHYFLNQIKHHIQYYKNQKINLLDKKNREQVIKSNNFIYFVKKKVFKNSLLFFYLYYFLQKLMFSSAIYNIKKYDFSVNNNFIIKLSFVIWSFIYLFYSIF